VKSGIQKRKIQNSSDANEMYLRGVRSLHASGGGFKKVIHLWSIFQLAIVTIALAPPARAENAVEAKIGYCQDCHGHLGQGYRGYYPIPRLAGQQVEYIKNQLSAFIERRRTNNIMFSVAHVLRPAEMTTIATKFHSFDPGPIGGVPKARVAAGKRIFEDGIPEENVAACAACHGPNAEGRGQFPRLAGQLYPYTIKALSNWSSERGQIPGKPDASVVMAPVAHSLSRQEIEAVAAYVGTLK
jgi:cytochrome c553